VLGTAALALLGVVVAAVTGDPIPSLAAFASYSGMGRMGLAGVVVVAFVANGIGEETGWRGFAADRLLRNHSLSRTSFLVAAVWVRRIGGAHLGLPEHGAERSARRGAAHGVLADFDVADPALGDEPADEPFAGAEVLTGLRDGQQRIPGEYRSSVIRCAVMMKASLEASSGSPGPSRSAHSLQVQWCPAAQHRCP
jgi:hypothetical protein